MELYVPARRSENFASELFSFCERHDRLQIEGGSNNSKATNRYRTDGTHNVAKFPLGSVSHRIQFRQAQVIRGII